MYLRSQRLAAGLSQFELGKLLGVSEDVISNCEVGRSVPRSAMVLGCELVFGKHPAKLFPALYEIVQEAIGIRAAALDERLRGRTDPSSLKKLRLLKRIAERSIAASDL